LWAVPVRDNLSLAPTKSKQAPAPGRSVDNQRQTGPAVVLGGLILSPCDNPGVEERGFSPTITQLLQLTGLISPACDRYVQYLLIGANPSVLNRHRWGLQLWRCRFATYHSPTFPTSCLHCPLMTPPGLPFNQVPSTKPNC
jgi:hypothetical protein